VLRSSGSTADSSITSERRVVVRSARASRVASTPGGREARFAHVVQAPRIARAEAAGQRARHAREPVLSIEGEDVDAREPVAIALALDVDDLRAVLDPGVLASGLAQLLVEAEGAQARGVSLSRRRDQLAEHGAHEHQPARRDDHREREAPDRHACRAHDEELALRGEGAQPVERAEQDSHGQHLVRVARQRREDEAERLRQLIAARADVVELADEVDEAGEREQHEQDEQRAARHGAPDVAVEDRHHWRRRRARGAQAEDVVLAEEEQQRDGQDQDVHPPQAERRRCASMLQPYARGAEQVHVEHVGEHGDEQLAVASVPRVCLRERHREHRQQHHGDRHRQPPLQLGERRDVGRREQLRGRARRGIVFHGRQLARADRNPMLGEAQQPEVGRAGNALEALPVVEDHRALARARVAFLLAARRDRDLHDVADAALDEHVLERAVLRDALGVEDDVSVVLRS
jgi:hypothetical protein